jgi:hypothetical protein
MNFLVIAILLIINVLYWHISANQTTFEEKKRLWINYLPREIHHFLFVLTISLIGFFINKNFQVFCQPVLWAGIMLSLVVLNIAIYSLISQKNNYLEIPSGFIQGIAIATFLYMLLFGWDIFLVWLILGLPILRIGFIFSPFDKTEIVSKNTNLVALVMYELFFAIFSPVLLLFKVIKNFEKAYLSFRISLLFGFIFILSFALFYSTQYKNLSKEIKGLNGEQIIQNKILSERIKNQYIGERIIGMHFKYHTETCTDDGWRPPLHDPFLVFAMWINQNEEPLPKYPLTERIKIYKALFPEKPLRARCACADDYAKFYWKDKVLDE